MHPKSLRISDFDYQLPNELVAFYPSSSRDASRLLVNTNGQIEDRMFDELPELLLSNTLLVFNNTKVIPARLIMAKPSGGKVEIMLLRPHKQTMQASLAEKETTVWECLVGGAKKWKEGAVSLEFGGKVLQAWNEGRIENYFLVRFKWPDWDAEYGDVLQKVGKIPLPPYISRDVEEADKQRYQTVFAQVEGSVAAPTAGLHFTQKILERIRNKGIATTEVTLHVSAGTFLPVTANEMEGHAMHAEVMEVSIDALQTIREHQGPVVAVGTTACRTLESLYWLGYRAKNGISVSEVHQWEPYNDDANRLTKIEALQALEIQLKAEGKDTVMAETSLMIAPGYDYRIANGLFTNFHQPKSTLLLLVAALVGDGWKEMYQHAIQNKYRFFSYGDACFLMP